MTNVQDDLNQAKALAFIELRKELVLSKLGHGQRFEENLIKSLMLANGAALVVLGSALDALIGHGASIALVKAAFSVYLLGIMFAAGVLFVYTKVMGDAPSHFYQQYVNYLENRIQYNELTDYGFTQIGRRIFIVLMMLSFACFIVGSILGIIIL